MANKVQKPTPGWRLLQLSLKFARSERLRSHKISSYPSNIIICTLKNNQHKFPSHYQNGRLTPIFFLLLSYDRSEKI